MKKRKELFSNLTRFFTLDLLDQEPKHGYGLMKELKPLLGKKPSPGQIYPMLKELREKNLIDVQEKGDREKKVYELTKEGKEKHSRLINRFNDTVSVILEPKLSKCSHCGCRVYEGGYKEEIGGEELLFCCEHCADHYKRGR